MKLHYAELADIIRRDPRYAFEAYQFVFDALTHTTRMLGRKPLVEPGAEVEPHHVSGRELLDGIRDLALREFGLMARTVFHMWGIERTDDFGEIVFNLIESKRMHKSEQDVRTDFHDVYDLDEALVEGYRIRLDEVP